MKRKAKKVLKTVVSLAVAFMMLAISPCMQVNAAEENVANVMETEGGELPQIMESSIESIQYPPTNPLLRTGFMQNGMVIKCSSDEMKINIHVGTTSTASVVGIKNVKVDKKGLLGWTTVAVSDGGESYNCSGMSMNFYYYEAVKGATYRVSCTYYFSDASGYVESSDSTDPFVFTY